MNELKGWIEGGPDGVLREPHGRVLCGRCQEWLGYAYGSATFATPHAWAEYQDRDGRHRFLCRSQECRRVSNGRGTLSYLDRLPAPGETARTRQTLRREYDAGRRGLEDLEGLEVDFSDDLRSTK